MGLRALAHVISQTPPFKEGVNIINLVTGERPLEGNIVLRTRHDIDLVPHTSVGSE